MIINIHIQDFEKQYKCNYQDKLFIPIWVSFIGTTQNVQIKASNKFDGFTGPEFQFKKWKFF